MMIGKDVVFDEKSIIETFIKEEESQVEGSYSDNSKSIVKA